MTTHVFNEDMELLIKASKTTKPGDFIGSELMRLSRLLDMDALFDNFPEIFLREYRDSYSGQHIQGMQVNRSASSEITSFTFIPHHEATRAQVYEGFIFSIINPAARNMTRILYWLNASDYARMSIADAAGWGYLSNALAEIGKWSRYLEIVCHPGAVIAPMPNVADTSNLLALDSLIFSRVAESPFRLENLDRAYYERIDLA